MFFFKILLYNTVSVLLYMEFRKMAIFWFLKCKHIQFWLEEEDFSYNPTLPTLSLSYVSQRNYVICQAMFTAYVILTLYILVT